MQLGMIGFGRMGANMVRRLIKVPPRSQSWSRNSQSHERFG